ncbi:hypothetical protein S40285_09804 [Stachybotrys chlorohalonatus IBT 40285]|uniref:Uncharacterized protein n=1 Tax=Stachybotrys chlorohalonatus (strain IBT 40285) TaxID=1283841 RepID=A0A084QZ48_STAC4|nr:hypothetical protein S40285_09804 [Stachybotrys chlorohalonata IBT 40285]
MPSPTPGLAGLVGHASHAMDMEPHKACMDKAAAGSSSSGARGFLTGLGKAWHGMAWPKVRGDRANLEIP